MITVLGIESTAHTFGIAICNGGKYSKTEKFIYNNIL